jgi:small-conductance mechanosensitive channel
MQEFLRYTLFEIGSYVITVESVLIILVIYIVTFTLIRFLSGLFRRMAKRRDMEPGRQYSFLMLMRYFIWIIAIGVMLHAIGVKLTFLLASSAALLVGIGLGLQRLFSDFMSGVFMLFDGTIERGHILQVGDMVGVVEKISLRTTILRDRNDVNIIIPNHLLTEDKVVNWSHNAPVTRFIVGVGVSYGSDMEQVKEILLDCAAKHPHVVTDNREYVTSVRLAEFADSGVNFELMFYSANMFRIENTKSELRFLIWHAFQEQGIVIPFPQRDLHLKSGFPGM